MLNLLPRMGRGRALGALLALACSLPAWASRTDVVVLNNGDQITGEVRQLAFGQLQFTTDDMGTLSIEWDKIRSLASSQQLQIELLDGRRFFGKILEGEPEPGSLRVLATQTSRGAEQEYLLLMVNIARINVLDSGSLLDRLDGSVSLGYSFAQSTGVSVFNLSAEVGTRNRQRAWHVRVDSQLTNQDSGPASQRWSLVGSLSRPLRQPAYYREASLEFTGNDQLGLELRGLLSGTVGRFLRVTPNSQWRAGAGLAASRERGTDGSERNNLELQLGTDFRLFRLDSPRSSINAVVTVLPSLNDWGRWRSESSLDLRQELVKDLFFEVSVYNSYDNRPADGAATNDWGVTTSIGYSF